jgi:DNA-binding PadR family transcriptional regulator
MLTRLLILWLLSEQSLHGYQIKKTLDEDSLRFWFPVEYGSVYAVLRTMVKQGYVTPAGVEREGRRPERTRFAITRDGRRHLEDLLRRAWRELPSPADPVHVALAARSELDEAEVGELLEQRAAALGERLAALDRLSRSAPAWEMVERQRALTETELRWAQAVSAGRPATAGESRGGAGEMSSHGPDVQPIVNVVAERQDGRVLMVRYHTDDDRWWLPGEDMEPYQHPDEGATMVLGRFPGLHTESADMASVESFRGRRGWHLVFHYHARVAGEPAGEFETGWFLPGELPRTVHGRWERQAVERVLGDRTG